MSSNDLENLINKLNSNNDPQVKIILMKYASRLYRNGDINTVKKCGRKPVSPEHKAETYKKWYEKKKQVRIDAGILPKKIGRPKKVLSSELE